MHNPYATLGLPAGASREEAQQAYRKLAMKHHPDRGGDEARFKEVKAAWEQIEAGWTAPPPSPKTPEYRSSFSSDKTSKRRERPPAYAAPRRPSMPAVRNGTVHLEVTAQQAFEGCVVPFLYRGHVLDFQVRPGTMSYDSTDTFVVDELVGRMNHETVQVRVVLTVVTPETHTPTEPPRADEPGDMEVTLRVCALGLFTGGQINTRDHLNELVQVTLPVGYDPSEPIIVKGHGYGPKDRRGDLRVRIEPVFKDPGRLTKGELRQLARLNELAER